MKAIRYVDTRQRQVQSTIKVASRHHTPGDTRPYMHDTPGHAMGKSEFRFACPGPRKPELIRHGRGDKRHNARERKIDETHRGFIKRGVNFIKLLKRTISLCYGYRF